MNLESISVTKKAWWNKAFEGHLARAMKMASADLSKELKITAWQQFESEKLKHYSNLKDYRVFENLVEQFTDSFARRYQERHDMVLEELRNTLCNSLDAKDFKEFFARFDSWMKHRTNPENICRAYFVLSRVFALDSNALNSADKIYDQITQKYGLNRSEAWQQVIKPIRRKLVDWEKEGCQISEAVLNTIEKRKSKNRRMLRESCGK